MKKILLVIWFFLLVVLLFWGGYQMGRNSVLPSKADTVRLRDTIELSSPAVIKEIPVPVPAKVDTAAILSSYYTLRMYNDNVINTPYLKVSIVDTVFQNRLLGRTASYQFSFPQRNHAVTLGLMSGYRHISLMGGYRYKRWEIQGGYDFYNKAPMVGVKYDLLRW